MALAPGTRLGAYEVTSLIGEGGMGEVYRATDSHLKRVVAIKVLPASVAGDADRVMRFQREAEVLAALNHPNIAAIYGLEKTADVTALVMELVEGDDLSYRIAQGAMPVEDALQVARQIAQALEAAHEKGIVHRDLKPANVKVREDGTVKVLDFGLAKAFDPSPTPPAGNAATANPGPGTLDPGPTMTSPALTQMGVILGTAGYMSPEQARGKPVDKRADIWAFGCVLYEMLAGRHAFEGETITDVLGAIVKSEPDWAALPPGTPGPVRALIRRCLQKDPSKRLRDIGDAHTELAGEVVEESPGMPPARRDGSVVSRLLPWAIALVALATAAATWATRGGGPADGPVRILQVDKGAGIVSPVIAPDGQRVVYVRDGRLVVRRLDEAEGREIAGSENAANPFWSDDSRSIGYFAQGSPIQVRLVSVEDGSQRVVASGPSSGRVTGDSQGAPFAPFGGAACGDAVYFIIWGRGVMRASEGSEPAVAAPLDAAKGETNWAHPSCLPDGRLLAVLRAKSSTLMVIDGDRRIPLLEGGIVMPVFARPNHVVYERSEGGQTSIWAVPVTRDVSATTGPPARLMPGSDPSVSRDGSLVALTGVQVVERQLVWTDRSGTRLSTFGRPQRRILDPAISPDGARVAVASGGQLWLHHESAVREFGEAGNAPAWSPDGRFLAYTQGGRVGERVMARAVEGAAPARVLAEGPASNFAWAPDGRSVVVQQPAGLSLVAVDKPSELQQLVANAGSPAISPDGHLLAYVAFAMDRDEVFVTTFPKPGPVWPVSVGGGRRPRWNPKGGELFFTGGPRVGDDPNSHRDLFAARIDTRNGVTIEPPVRLFDAPARGLAVSSQPPRTYDVAPDGQRLIVSTDGRAGTPTITLVDRLEALVRARR